MKPSFKRRLAIFLTVTLFSVFLLPGTASAAAPGAPTGLTAVSGNSQVVLSWTAPASTGGGGGISDYIIEYSPDAGTTYYQFIDSVSTATSITVTGLTNTWTYSFRVYAKNAGDLGPASAVATAIPALVHTPADLPLFSACPTGVIPASSFTDITTNYSASVDCIKYYGITKGTTDTTYSPNDPVTRWQMALFLTRMASTAGTVLPDGSAQGFSDISNYSNEIKTAINQLKQLGITIGKTATTYAPADNVTREEMALFINRLLLKAKVGPGGNEEFVSGFSGLKEIKSNDTDSNFTDLTGGLTFESINAIAKLWNLGVTDSQSVEQYEPTKNMTRKAMAIFMANALAHTNARPAGLVIQASAYRVPGSPAVYFSVTHRDSNFNPISGSYVDTFKYTLSGLATSARFDANGFCKDTILTSIGNIKCTLDAADPKTDVNGNLATFFESIPTLSTQEIYAWTSSPTTSYDNDVHANGVTMVTVVTYSG